MCKVRATEEGPDEKKINHAPHGAGRHRRHSHPRRPGPRMPCAQAHQTGSLASSRPPSTALCGTPRV
eukprot:scaffold111746_cov71-Phaeocystis_antarctica.AAC.1